MSWLGKNALFKSKQKSKHQSGIIKELETFERELFHIASSLIFRNRLCLQEKFEILSNPSPDELLNKSSKFFKSFQTKKTTGLELNVSC